MTNFALAEIKRGRTQSGQKFSALRKVWQPT